MQQFYLKLRQIYQKRHIYQQMAKMLYSYLKILVIQQIRSDQLNLYLITNIFKIYKCDVKKSEYELVQSLKKTLKDQKGFENIDSLNIKVVQNIENEEDIRKILTQKKINFFKKSLQNQQDIIPDPINLQKGEIINDYLNKTINDYCRGLTQMNKQIKMKLKDINNIQTSVLYQIVAEPKELKDKLKFIFQLSIIYKLWLNIQEEILKESQEWEIYKNICEYFQNYKSMLNFYSGIDDILDREQSNFDTFSRLIISEQKQEQSIPNDELRTYYYQRQNNEQNQLLQINIIRNNDNVQNEQVNEQDQYSQQNVTVNNDIFFNEGMIQNDVMPQRNHRSSLAKIIRKGLALIIIGAIVVAFVLIKII